MSRSYTADCFSGGGGVQTNMQQIENNFAALKSNFYGTGNPPNLEPGMLFVNDANQLCVVDSTTTVRVLCTINTLNFNLKNNNVTAAMIDGSARKPSLVSGQTISPTTINATNGNFTNLSVAGYSMVPNYAPGYYKIGETVANVVPTSWSKIFDLYTPRSGTLAVRLSLAYANGTVYARTYINGSPYGPVRSRHGEYVNYNENVSVSAGDRLQVHAYQSVDGYYQARCVVQVGVANPMVVTNYDDYYGFITYTGPVTAQ